LMLAAAPATADDAAVAKMVQVNRPTGEGWQCTSAAAEDEKLGVQAWSLKCKRVAGGDFFFMKANTYTVKQEDVLTAETLVKKTYAAEYEKTFDTYTPLKTAPAKLGALDAWELEMEAVHSARGKIHKRERVATVGRQVMLVSAEGDPAAFKKFGKEIDAWFKEPKFTELRSK